MKIDDYTKAKIKANAEGIFKHYGLHLNRGKCLCPFHDDKTPSFIAKQDKAGEWFWSCRSCGVHGGDILSFVAEMEGLDQRKDFTEVLKRAAKAANLAYLLDDTRPRETMGNTELFTQKNTKTPTILTLPPMYLNAQAQTMAVQVDKTNLFKYLCQYWEQTEVKRVMELYCVGLGYRLNTKSNFELIAIAVTLQRVNACSAFPSIDTEGNTHAIKIIPYPLADHHRAKADDTAPMMIYKPSQNPGTYFGTHLLAQDTNKPVALVESEKTAIIGTLFMPVYTWIATGSFANFNVRMVKSIEALKPRQIHLFPDSDKAEEWKATANELRALGYNIFVRDEIIKLFPADSGTDIADVIIWEMQNQRKREGEGG